LAASVYIVSMIDESPLRIRYEAVRSSLDERGRRLNAAAEAKAAGYGGIAAASRVTKLARSTIGRRKGGGSPRLATKDPTLLVDLERLLKLATMGDPMRALRWVSKSHDKLATALRAIGHKVSSSSIPKLPGGTEVLPPFQPQDQGRRQTSRSRRSIRIHQRQSRVVSSGGSAGDIDRREEAGIARRVQETPTITASEALVMTPSAPLASVRNGSTTAEWPPRRP
jgi:hypothetical protein